MEFGDDHSVGLALEGGALAEHDVGIPVAFDLLNVVHEGCDGVQGSPQGLFGRILDGVRHHAVSE